MEMGIYPSSVLRPAAGGERIQLKQRESFTCFPADFQ